MSDDLVLNLTATSGALIQGLAQVEEYCAREQFGRSVLARLMIIVEELITNSIKYGYGGECDSPIRLTLRREDDAELRVEYEDAARPFDPTAWDTAPVLDASADDRPVGRTGIALVLGFAAGASYRRLDGWNRLSLLLPLC